jgi:Flp pilus assembly pilin Flp
MRARQARFRKALRRLWQDRSGAAILEFAMVLPPLCLILLGMFEVAMLMFCQASMEGALREAARYGVTGQDNATPAVRIAKIKQIVGDAEQIIRYTVEYDWPLMTPFMARIMGNAEGRVPLIASIVLRNEPWNIKEAS